MWLYCLLEMLQSNVCFLTRCDKLFTWWIPLLCKSSHQYLSVITPIHPHSECAFNLYSAYSIHVSRIFAWIIMGYKGVWDILRLCRCGFCFVHLILHVTKFVLSNSINSMIPLCNWGLLLRFNNCSFRATWNLKSLIAARNKPHMWQLNSERIET